MNSKKSSKSRSEPRTMAELLAMAEKRIRGFSSGQKVKGKVVGITGKTLILDIGGKSEGVVAEKAYSEARDLIKKLKVGDEVMTTVIVPETPDGVPLLSLRQAAYDFSWAKLEEAKKKGEVVAVFGKGTNPSGVTVEVEGLLGFIPGSQLGKESAKNPQNLIGKYFKAKVLDVDRLANKVVLSEREVTDAADIEEAKKILGKIKEGDVYSGLVTTVANFGCFVKIKAGGAKKIDIEGLVHVSELSWGKVEMPSDIVKEGDRLKVKVIGIKDGKLALSIKQAEKDPWEAVAKKYKKDSPVVGKVVKISDFGTFVELEPGVEGLIHLTKIPPGMKINEGESVNCYIEDIDVATKKIALGLILTSKPVGYK